MAVALSIVVPLLDEAESLRELHAELGSALATIPGEAEIIFVDDGSADRSFETIRALARIDSRVRGVQFRRNYGKSAALAAGFARARGARVVMIDADLQDDPAQIPRLLARLDEGFDLVSGWKQDRQDGWLKLAASRLFNATTGLLTGVRMHDINCGLKAFSREVAHSIRIYGELHRFMAVLAHEEGFRLSEVEVPHRPRKHGRSKFGARRIGAGFYDLLTVLFLGRYGRKPLHFFGRAGVAVALLGAGITGWLTYERVVHRVYLTNRPLLIAGVFMVIVGLQLVSVGLLGEMITAHSEANRMSPSYGVRGEVGFD